MESAVVALGFSKDETVIDWLTQHKVSGDDYNFPTKFTAIGRIGGPKAANFLVSHIGNPKVLTMFREIGIDAIPALANALDAGELLAWLPLKTLGWRPQTLNQRICVAILEQDRGLLEAVTVQHFDQVAKCFDAAYGSSKIDREHWDRVGGQNRGSGAVSRPMGYRHSEERRWSYVAAFYGSRIPFPVLACSGGSSSLRALSVAPKICQNL